MELSAKGIPDDTGYGRFLWLSVFAAAMGLLEAIVVVYLRELYYPAGFAFPLASIPEDILLTEILREGCTIVMLTALALLCARGAYMRLACFLFTFGAWDIFYYAALKLLLGWPPSLLTWDILFLIPAAWLAPVLAPVICALTMVAMGLLIARLIREYGDFRAGSRECSLVALGAFVIFLTFIWDFSGLAVSGGFLKGLHGPASDRGFREAVSGYLPKGYNWYAFGLGEAMVLLGIRLAWLRTRAAGRARGDSRPRNRPAPD